MTFGACPEKVMCYAKAMVDALGHDLAAIARISAVPTILRTIRESTNLRFTLIARVLPDRWVACAVHDELGYGLKVGGELDVATMLCSSVRDTRQPIVIECASTDPVYCNHPTPKLYGFESYIAVPIFRRDGAYFGNVCGFDPLPCTLGEGKTLSMMTLFSELISLQLDAEEELEGNRRELGIQREAAQLRERFIAVLGHDVRNPLASIVTGAELLLMRTSGPDRRTLERILSSGRRIGTLVDDLLDLARGRLGGGIPVETARVDDLTMRLQHVISEVASSHPDRPIDTRIALERDVRCDAKRIEQLLSNLLANAVQHGEPRTPITVTAAADESSFQLQVANLGPPIPEDAMNQLFQPYFRGAHRGAGLGLGLYIASEIARSHRGALNVASSPQRTAFTLRMPRSLDHEA